MRLLTTEERAQLHEAIHEKDDPACGEVLQSLAHRAVQTDYRAKGSRQLDDIKQDVLCRLAVVLSELWQSSNSACCRPEFFDDLEKIATGQVTNSRRRKVNRLENATWQRDQKHPLNIHLTQWAPESPIADASKNELWNRVETILYSMEEAKAVIIRWEIAELHPEVTRLSRGERATLLGISVDTYDKRRLRAWEEFKTKWGEYGR